MINVEPNSGVAMTKPFPARVVDVDINDNGNACGRVTCPGCSVNEYVDFSGEGLLYHYDCGTEIREIPERGSL